MARTSISPTAGVMDSSATTSAGTTIDATLVTNGVVIPAPDFSRLLLTVNNTALADKAITLKTGVNPPASLASQGDKSFTVPTTGTVDIGPFTSGRFSQANGDFYIDFASGFTGTITVRQLPRV